MVYIIIPKIYEDAFLYTSNDDYKQIHIKNYDFTIGNYIFFHFNQKNIDFIIQKKDYIILDNHPIIIKNDFMMNYSEEINNITDNNSVKISLSDEMEIFENENIIFKGQYKNYIPNGYGINYTEKYEGFYKNGLKHGPGTLTINDKKIYEGEFKNNLFHGQGKFYHHDKISYKGEFKNNNYHGFGIQYYKGKKIYEGDFENNFKNGDGIHYINDRIFYIGEFSNDCYHGYGTTFSDNGIKTSYEFKNGIKIYNDLSSISNSFFSSFSYTSPLSNKYVSKNPLQFTFHTSGLLNILSKLGFILQFFFTYALYLVNPSPLNA